MTDDKQSGHSAQASKAQDSKAQDAAVVPPENANIMPGGSLNTAGGKMREAGVIDAVKTIRLSELAEVHQKPCVRESFMTGIGAGFGVGSLRAVLGGKSPVRFLHTPRLNACSTCLYGLQLGCGLIHLWILSHA